MNFDDYKRAFVSFEDNPIGEGGFKRVYRAVHDEFGPVVVKVLFRGVDDRSEREISILRDNAFRYIPRLFAVDEVEYGEISTLAMVEEYIDGQCLKDIIAAGKRYSLSEAIAFLEQSLAIIDEYSASGIVHRDIKPDNIIVRDGQLYFIDFGIARVIDAETRLTKTGDFIPHTPGYAAPEVVRQDKDIIDVKSDLYSIGVVVYELISGVNPFRVGVRAVAEMDVRTLTITPRALQIPGDEHREFMGFISALTSRPVFGRPKDAEEALRWLEAAKRSCNLKDA